MSALKMILAGGVAAAALVSAAPVSAQYYPGNPYGGYGGYGGYGRLMAATTARRRSASAPPRSASGSTATRAATGLTVAAWRLRRWYGGARVLGISRIEQSSNGGLTIRGVANSGRDAGYALWLWLQRPDCRST